MKNIPVSRIYPTRREARQIQRKRNIVFLFMVAASLFAVYMVHRW